DSGDTSGGTCGGVHPGHRIAGLGWGGSVGEPPHGPAQSDRAREVDVGVETVGGVIAGHQVGAARVDDVQPSHRVESDLEEVAEREVAGGRYLHRVDEAVADGAAEAGRGPGVDVPVAVHGLVGEVADPDGVPVAGDVHPAVADEPGVRRCDVLP